MEPPPPTSEVVVGGGGGGAAARRGRGEQNIRSGVRDAAAAAAAAGQLHVGAGTTLVRLKRACEGLIESLPAQRCAGP